jgi:arabinogalactan oligomer/maltooligosaccharide transport system permease protein
VLERQLDRLSVSNKINKDLYLRAKTKLLYDEKRTLVSLKTSFKSKNKVLVESLKQLKSAKTFLRLLNYEIKKSRQEKGNLKLHINNYYIYLTKTIDDSEEKITSFKQTLKNYKKKEINEITKQIYLGLIKHFYQIDSRNFPLLDFHDLKMQTNLSKFEKDYIASMFFDQKEMLKMYETFNSIIAKSNIKYLEIKEKISNEAETN